MIVNFYKSINYNRWATTSIIIFLILLSSVLFAQYPSGSPVAINGKLKVIGTKLSNECGNPVQLKGMSSHGVQWYPKCYNSTSLDALSKDWKADIFRVAMYVQEGGYITNPGYWKSFIDKMVDECGKRGMYCLIDWHVLNPGDPMANINEAREFWGYMSSKHAGKKHVLYEICNEPNGVSWAKIKSYADDIIPRIRANDANSIVIVGTPNWSQDVDLAAKDKLSYENVLYTLHFYSGTHTEWLRTKANAAISKGLALFVTEFGTSLASGDGGPFLAEGDVWMNWMASNNVSWCNWSFSDKAEVSAALSSGSCGGNWNSTTQSGAWVKGKLASKNFNCNSGSVINKTPVVTIISPVNNESFNAGATIGINVNATDPDGTISKVEFFNGTTKLGEDLTAPYTYLLTYVAKGTYTITAKATDNAGAFTTSAAVSFIVVSTNQAPTVSVTLPFNNSSYSAPATITLNASSMDVDGTVIKVEFYNGTTKLGEDASAPYTYFWPNVAVGTYSITAKATDNSNATSTSSMVTMIVAPNKVPAIYLTSPQNNSSFKSQAAIKMSATATDADGSIAKVEFFNGTNKLGESLLSPYNFTWENVGIGTYSITSKATDNSGAVTTSSAIIISVSSVSGVEEDVFFQSLKIYPNPAEKDFTIESTSGGLAPVNYELYNQSGQKVWKGNDNNSHVQKVDCHHFPKGMYILKVEKNQLVKQLKVTIF